MRLVKNILTESLAFFEITNWGLVGRLVRQDFAATIVRDGRVESYLDGFAEVLQCAACSDRWRVRAVDANRDLRRLVEGAHVSRG